MEQFDHKPLLGWELLPYNNRINRHVLTPLPVRMVEKIDRFIQREGVVLLLNPDEEYLYPSKSFSLIISTFAPPKLDSCHRLLKPGGILLIQAFDPPESYKDLSDQLQQNGFRVLDSYQDFNRVIFYDPGATIYHLQSPPWDLPPRELLKLEEKINQLYPLIQKQKHIAVETNHLLIIAKR